MQKSATQISGVDGVARVLVLLCLLRVYAAVCHVSLIHMILQEIIEGKFTQVQPRRERNKT